MRVTNNMISMMYSQGLNTTLGNLIAANERVSAGRNLLNPEDDAVYYLTAYNMQIMSNEATQYKRNGENALTWLETADSVLQTASEYLTTALNELAEQGMNDTQNADSRKALAGEVLSIYQAMMDIGNTQYLDRYIFSGYETGTEPFTSGEREVSAVSSSKAGTEAITKKLYSDMTELKEGKYKATVTVLDGVAYVTMKDGEDNTVLLDSNGSDESTAAGNRTSTTLTTEYTGETVINTGLGVGFVIPDGINNGEDFTIDFYYVPGDDISYQGDDGEITSKIASNQSVTINVSGQDLYMETNRTITGTTTNTINGLTISETTKFSQIDGANACTADNIKFSGTDHNGYAVGTAQLTSPGKVDLDMSEASEEERSITLSYASREYTITMDQKGYASMDNVIFDINRDLEDMGLGGEITAVADGNNIMFISSRTGDETNISVQGSLNNTLGFGSSTISATGTDTVFNLSYDDFTGPVTTTHTDVDMSAAGTYKYYVNGTPVQIDVTAADDAASIQDKLNQALMDKNLGFTVFANVVDGTGAGLYDVSFKLQNTELTDDTSLMTKIGTDFQSDNARGTNYPEATEKRVGDMMEFIEALYGNAVDASIQNGQIQIQDLRSGESRLTFAITENNSGIGYAEIDQNVVFSGTYNGTRDDEWNVNVNVDTLTSEITINVTDSKGNTIYDNSASPIIGDSYKGDEIYIANGVSITLGEISVGTSFTVEMSANSNVSFGDLNVTEKGDNVNVLTSLYNLYEALNFNIAEAGIGAPSEWAENNGDEIATPYLDGEFTGNYNDIFTFEVQTYNNQSEFYLQQDQTWNSETLKYYSDVDVSFDIVLKSDATANDITTLTVNVPATDYTDADSLMDQILSQINSNLTLQNMGVRAYDDNGELKLDTGSGNTEISVSYNNTETSYVMGMSDTSPASGETQPDLELNSPSTLDVSYYDISGSSWNSFSLTVPSGDYADYSAIVTELNADLVAQGLDSQFQASVNGNGIITINSLDTAIVADIIVSGDESGTLGFYNKAEARTITSSSTVTMDLSEANSAERTLTFSYNDGSEKTVSITVDAENYPTYEDLVANINEKLADQGISSIVTCELVDGDSLGFVFDPSVSDVAVAGDYNSTLGVSKGGDLVKIKITGDDGELINTYTMDSANELYFVADGVYQSYDAGYLYATDYFTATVGSGIEHEMEVLQQAQTQVLSALTTVGNSVNKADSAITFNENVVTTTEELKAKYTGSTTIDKTQASADLSLAETAYEAALQVTAYTMSVSLLDYL
ncbi:MAG: hypothetical protein AB7E96_08175 [Deferribacterales bacterium]